MSSNSKVRDSRLIDALEGLPRKRIDGVAWRVVREGRDPLQCSASGGRWDDGTFDVLYTSREQDGAISEMFFHLLRGQPIFPSKVRYSLFELNIVADELMALSMNDLTALGLDATKFGQLAYNERTHEYPRTQDVAETAHFLDCDGLIVPSARWSCDNIVLFCDRLKPGAIEVVRDHGNIDWKAWQAKTP